MKSLSPRVVLAFVLTITMLDLPFLTVNQMILSGASDAINYISFIQYGIQSGDLPNHMVQRSLPLVGFGLIRPEWIDAGDWAQFVGLSLLGGFLCGYWWLLCKLTSDSLEKFTAVIVIFPLLRIYLVKPILLPDILFLCGSIVLFICLMTARTKPKFYLNIFFISIMLWTKQNFILYFFFAVFYYRKNLRALDFVLAAIVVASSFLINVYVFSRFTDNTTGLTSNVGGVFRLMSEMDLKSIILYGRYSVEMLVYGIPTFALIALRLIESSPSLKLTLILSSISIAAPFYLQPLAGGPWDVGANNAARQFSLVLPFLILVSLRLTKGVRMPTHSSILLTLSALLCSMAPSVSRVISDTNTWRILVLAALMLSVASVIVRVKNI